MLNVLFQKIAEHYILGRLSSPLTRFHALIVGYRTDLAIVAWIGTYILQYAGILDHDKAEHARAYVIGAGVITGADKLTRYGSIVDGLVVKAKALEEEKKDQ